MKRKLGAPVRSKFAKTLLQGAVALTTFMLLSCGSRSDDTAPDRQAGATETVVDPLLERRDRVQQQIDQLPTQRKSDLDTAIEADER